MVSSAAPDAPHLWAWPPDPGLARRAGAGISRGLWQRHMAGKGSCWALGQTGAGSPLGCPGLALPAVLEKGVYSLGRGLWCMWQRRAEGTDSNQVKRPGLGTRGWGWATEAEAQGWLLTWP